jgi:hypothetical protein
VGGTASDADAEPAQRLAAALLVGTGLVAVVTLRERRPVAGFGVRLADLR